MATLNVLSKGESLPKGSLLNSPSTIEVSQSLGRARVRAEYVINYDTQDIPNDDAAEASTSHILAEVKGDDTSAALPDSQDGSATGEPPLKKAKLSGAQKKRLAKEKYQNQKKQKGMNTGRKFAKVREDLDLCYLISTGRPCDGGTQCRGTHDIAAYLAAKPKDIHFPPLESLSTNHPFAITSNLDTAHPLFPTLDLSTKCPVFSETGSCRQGLRCRFLGSHSTVVPSDNSSEAAKVTMTTDENKVNERKSFTTEMNSVSIDTLRKVRSGQYPTPITNEYVKELELIKDDGPRGPISTQEEPRASLPNESLEDHTDTPDVPLRKQEKKRLHWSSMKYLAPLTTVGNLPFRRLCVDLGADITCGEMALTNSLLGGSKEEWSLIRRHPSEKIFGVQLAGNKPGPLTKMAEVLKTQLGKTGEASFSSGIDFVDVNCGCPIDMVYNSGAGSALLDYPGRLGKILIGMNRSLGDIPLTIKVRTGVKEGKNTVHKLMPRLSGWNVGAITIHGRTRQQRYSKLADWPYIKQCVEALRESLVDEDFPPIPIFGGGDVFTYQQYRQNMEDTGVDGIMIGRGALIKPWIFTELNECREWDISSRERLEIIRKYAEYGLNHWGSDTVGVNTTRRFLCEALSFQYRYIPLGILETIPRINDRPPAFRGRDDLETLLASQNSADWVKVSEMFLGKAPEGWAFTPKHKSNAQGNEEGNG